MPWPQGLSMSAFSEGIGIYCTLLLIAFAVIMLVAHAIWWRAVLVAVSVTSAASRLTPRVSIIMGVVVGGVVVIWVMTLHHFPFQQ